MESSFGAMQFQRAYDVWSTNPKKFRESFRMDRPAFDALVEKLSPYLQQRKRARSDSIEPAERVYLALMWLGGGGAFNRLEAQTGRAATTISKSLHMVCEAICEALAGEVRLPNIDELRASAESVREKTGMHGCYGVLDGKCDFFFFLIKKCKARS